MEFNIPIEEYVWIRNRSMRILLGSLESITNSSKPEMGKYNCYKHVTKL